MCCWVVALTSLIKVVHLYIYQYKTDCNTANDKGNANPNSFTSTLLHNHQARTVRESFFTYH